MKKTFFTNLILACSKSAKIVLPILLIACWNLSLNAQCPISCNPSIQVSLDENCEAQITPDMILEGNNPCGPFTVTITGVTGDVVSATGTYGVMVTNSANNPCWGSISVEDKIDPVIDCGDPIDVSCFDLTTPGAVDGPNASDACGSVSLDFSDDEVDTGCSISTITRTWTATDESGNTATCDQIINVVRPALGDFDLPENRDGITGAALSCTNVDDDAFEDDVDSNILLDEYGNPHTSVTGVPTYNGVPVHNVCNFTATYDDQRIDVCDGTYKVLREWTIFDWCNSTSRVVNQIIKVADSNGPTITCPPNMTISPDFDNCVGSTILPNPTISDNCSGSTSLSSTADNGTISGIAIYDLPSDATTTVTYTAEDACENTSSCTFTIDVVDNVAPVPACDEHTIVTLTNTPEPAGLITIIDASVFDDGSYDNCSDVTFSVRRMSSCIDFNWTTQGAGIDSEPNNTVNNNDRGTTLKPAVPFSCCDVGETIMVELVVTDESDNSNSCMVEVEVQDKLNPLIQCPPNKTQDCGDHLDISTTTVNLTAAEAADLGVIATDNCDVSVSYSDTDNRDNCGVGQVLRRFTATDNGGRTATCTQRFTFTNNDAFDSNDINWPIDLTLDGCGIGLEPANLESYTRPAGGTGASTSVVRANARPNIAEDACDQVAVTKQDLYLPVVDGACVKVLRTWIVIDWCQYDQNNPTAGGRWEDTQLIKVNNSDGPSFTSDCDDRVFCSYEDYCGSLPVTMQATATDDCTPDGSINYSYVLTLDTNNDGTPDQVQTAVNSGTVSQTFLYGKHKIKWLAEDGCGNIAECEYLFEVKDCKAPTPYAYNGLAIDLMPNTATVEIWASDFDAGSFDNCEVVDFRIATPSGGPGQTTPPSTSAVSFDCTQLGTNTVDLWVQDNSGNWDYVSTYLIVQDNNEVCSSTTPTASIAGTIEDTEQDMVDQSTVMIEGSSNAIPTLTGNDGSYAFPGLAVGGNYTVTAEREHDVRNGVSAVDVYYLQRHILGLQPLTTPYQLIAADANNSQTITGLDIAELRKIILFVSDEFTNNGSWRFFDKNHNFINPLDPFAGLLPESISINNLSGTAQADFMGVKIGDLDGSAIPNQLIGSQVRTTVGDLVFQLEDAHIKAGETYTVDFDAKDFANVLAYQFTLGFDQTSLEFVDIKVGDLDNLNANDFGLALLDEGFITAAFANTNHANLNDDEAVFSLTFVAKQDVQLSEAININSRYTRAEAYNADAEFLNVAIQFNGTTTVAGEGFELYQNTPNPVNGKTTIGFNLPEAGAASLKIFDVSGKALKLIEGDYTKGYNEVNINKAELSASGVLYYQLETATEAATRKMIVID